MHTAKSARARTRRIGAQAAGVIGAIAPRGVFLWFLGLAATRVWLQCNLFAAYVQSDNGLFTIASNFSYGAVMAIGALAAWRRPQLVGRGTRLAWASFSVMTVATLAVIAANDAGSAALLRAGSVLAGVGGALGGGMWVTAYLKLDLHRAISCTFLSLALGSLGGLALSFLPEQTNLIASLFMPAIALLCFQRTLRVEPAAAAHPRIYDSEPKSTIPFILGGLAAFGLALGVSRGFPAGEPVPMDTAVRCVHQLGVVALSLLVIAWTNVLGRQLSFSLLWRVELALAAGGMLVLSLFPGHFTQLAIAIVNIADSFMLGVLWITLNDIARHTSVHPYAVYGFAWAVRIFSRNIGRIAIVAIGASSASFTVAIAIAVFALAASMAVLLSDGIPRMRPLFARDDGRSERGGAQGAGDVRENGPQDAPAQAGGVGEATAPAHAEGEARVRCAAPQPCAQDPAFASGGMAGMPDDAAVSQSAAASAVTAAAPEPSATRTAQGADDARSARMPDEDVRIQRARNADEGAPAQAGGGSVAAAVAADFSLTKRETEVAALIVQGRSKAYIASLLYLSENTVRTHTKTLYAKLDVHSKQELIDLFQRYERGA